MIKKKLAVLLLVFISAKGAPAQPVPSSSEALKVDGVYQNNEVVIYAHNPRFSWEFDFDSGSEQDIFELQVGTSDGGSDVWDVTRTSGYSYVVYGGAALASDTTYYWRVRITDDSLPAETSSWVGSWFHAVNSAVPVPAKSIVLYIDWNNPFNPAAGEITKVRYGINNGNEELKLRVYSLTGELIVTLAEHLGYENALYTVVWDGKNSKGEMVASGVYLVNLEAGSTDSKIGRVVVIK